MKKSLAFFSLLLVTVMSVTKAQAQTVSACFHDVFGYYWNVTLTVTGATYTGKGKVDVGSGFLWKVKVNGTCFGATKWVAKNPLADGCASGYTDYFQYDGNATAALFYGSEFRYDGSGTWNSYCSGSVINSGTWSGTDCYHSPSPGAKISKEG